MLCTEQSLVKTGEGWGVAIPLYCRSWACETCRPRRQQQLMALARSGNPQRFITLTVSRAIAGTAGERAKKLADAWRKVAKRVARTFPGPKMQYLAVFEATKLGSPHLHILQRGPFIPQRWLSAQMAELLKSRIVDIRRVNSASQAARYVAKYIGKEPQRFGTCKRYWHTKNWDQRDKVEEQTSIWGPIKWSISEQSLRSIWQDWKYACREPVISDWFTDGKGPGVKIAIVYFGTPPPSIRRWCEIRGQDSG
jgi:hypothetical protein